MPWRVDEARSCGKSRQSGCETGAGVVQVRGLMASQTEIVLTKNAICVGVCGRMCGIEFAIFLSFRHFAENETRK
jgi:hypothetical protein